MGLFGTEDNNDQEYTRNKITADPEAAEFTTSLGDQPFRVGASDKEAERETRFDGLAYGLAQDEGYTGTFEEFIQLMAENEDARKTVYEISQEDGFEGTMEQFDELLGLKKGCPSPTQVSNQCRRWLRNPNWFLVYWSETTTMMRMA